MSLANEPASGHTAPERSHPHAQTRATSLRQHRVCMSLEGEGGEGARPPFTHKPNDTVLPIVHGARRFLRRRGTAIASVLSQHDESASGWCHQFGWPRGARAGRLGEGAVFVASRAITGDALPCSVGARPHHLSQPDWLTAVRVRATPSTPAASGWPERKNPWTLLT